MGEKDVVMAQFCDERARECGEVVGEDGEDGREKERERGLVERVVEVGGDCCVPKSKREEGKGEV